MRPLLFWVAVSVAAAVPRQATAQTADNVLLVVNDSSAVSGQIGDYYARKRAVPSENVLHVPMPAADQISRAEYERAIETPVTRWFGRRRAQDRILYIVLTKDVPLRIAGTWGLEGTVASVDSELTLLYRRLTGARTPILGRIDNPYFAAETDVTLWKPFTHQSQDIFLVTRLDGFTVQDVIALIDRGLAPSADGKIILDGKGTLIDRGGNASLQHAATRLGSIGWQDRVVLDATSRVLTGERNVLGYYSWGSNDPAIRIRHFDFSFVPGALAGMFVSSDGRTFKEPPTDWKVGSADPKAAFAGTPQSLAGDLIREGVTGVAAHVAEPYLDAAVRPDILFPAYLSGFNLAESFYLATRFLSWQTVIVGDPLCAPFKRPAVPPTQIDAGLDSVTELPQYFSIRRVQAVMKLGLKKETAAISVRAEARLARGDAAGAQQAFEETAGSDLVARRMLGDAFQAAGESARAVEQYRAILAVRPNDAVVLNNLAYALAIGLGQAQEALSFAQRAYKLGGTHPEVVDTLGWVQHLLGNDAEAARLFSELEKQSSPDGLVHLHAAIVFDAVGRTSDALRELNRALALAPELALDENAIGLQRKLKR